ncbi:hypothetical protein NP233_g2408 [Leucocoprinus birnbaumii]|uniref:NADP-dependent oxidoreductase domain-containing protein n=1 Tax=Leucocoprinus birnbaumii TaxID=56174 RepID=A0AAD5VYC4_9AGAR|nr:hypothetical protein NP233_g2408 [Leucocoprinus birnbaumii]
MLAAIVSLPSAYIKVFVAMDRSFEREIFPMARAEGLALAPFNILAGGRFRTDDEQEKKVSKALEKVAAEVGAKHISAVAVAYVMHKTAHVFPILGGRTIEQLTANLEALEIRLSEEQIKFLGNATEFETGFPYSMIGDGTVHWQYGMSYGSYPEKQPLAPPIPPAPRSTSEEEWCEMARKLAKPTMPNLGAVVLVGLQLIKIRKMSSLLILTDREIIRPRPWDEFDVASSPMTSSV